MWEGVVREHSAEEGPWPDRDAPGPGRARPGPGPPRCAHGRTEALRRPGLLRPSEERVSLLSPNAPPAKGGLLWGEECPPSTSTQNLR